MRRKIVDLLIGIVAGVLVFAAVPVVLITLVGLPDPAHLALFHPTPRTAFDLLAIVAWVAWIGCCGPLLASVVRRVRHRDITTSAGARLPEWLASRIAAAVLVLVPVSLAAGGAAGATVPRAAVVRTAGPDVVPPAPGPATTEPISGVATTTTAGGGTGNPAPRTAVGYTVAPGDSLWSIAEQLYDDGSDWSTIAAANLGRLMDDGTRFVDPSLIRPGWVLALPPAPPAVAPAGPAAQSTTATAIPADTSGQPVTAPSGSVQPAAAGPVTAGPATTVPGSRTAGRMGQSHRSRPHRRAVAPTRPAKPATPNPSNPPSPMPLPELVALGTGVILAAALARRARRARHLASMARPEGEVTADPSEPAAATAADLVPFEDAPVLDWLEAANRFLHAALEAAERTGEVPPVRLVRVGSDGVEIRLARPVDWAPPGWALGDGQAWWLPSTVDLRVIAHKGQDSEPWLPALLPVGANEEGTWLIPAEPGACIPVIGPAADALVTAMRLAAESWAWSEQLVVTDDRSVAETESILVDRLAGGLGRPRVVFIGDPAGLSTTARQRCSVVTTLPIPATDLTVAVDAAAASLHPLGVVVHPDLLDDARRAAVAEVLAEAPDHPEPVTMEPVTMEPVTMEPVTMEPVTMEPLTMEMAPSARAAAGRPVVRRVSGGGPAGVGSTPAETRAGGRPDAGGDPVSLVTALVPGPIEIRLLTPVPRLDGLETAPTPKRARRAVELVAYLALHHPDPVTSDRLRTRVLGSADADAAAKTLFNTAGAARRAMGRDDRGDPFLPLATKGSHYRLSPRVTTDVGRATTLVALADAAGETDLAMAYLRAALELVEGEPLARAQSGYAWWQAEGHEQRIAGTLLDAACRLAPLAMAGGYVDLARWAIDQARLVEPYSEALCRVAMQVAADAGDADRLRREWQECLRLVDELDPGGLPSEATERLYVDLCRRVPVLTVTGTDGRVGKLA